jgi:Spy/CpxP family protein refolding chaperone
MNRPLVFTLLQHPVRSTVGMAVLLWASQWVWAQEATGSAAAPVALPSEPVTTTAAPAPAAAAPSNANKPAPAHKSAPHRDAHPWWSELTHEQQRALQPLAHSWATLSELHKRKWLVLSQNFSELPAQEQQKLQERMSDWTSLTALERAQARLHFAEVRQLPGDERRAKWEAYQALTPEQRRKLADDILLVPPRGAALASRPVAPSKLTQPPAAKPDQPLQPRIDTDQVQPKTLLPHFLQGTSTR